MNQYIIYALLSILSTFLLTLVFTPIILKIAHHYSWYDDIDPRKVHDGKIPRIGGVAIVLANIIVWGGFIVFRGLIKDQFAFVDLLKYLPFLFGAVLIHLVGLLDDFTDMRARYKLIGQIAAAGAVTIGGFLIHAIQIPFNGPVIELGIAGSYLFTFIWIIGITNAVNFIDGLDGLSGGIGAIVTLTFAVSAWALGSYTAGFMSFFLLGTILGFLLFNFPPAKIFMGDSGSLFIGFCLAVIPIITFRGTIAPQAFWLGSTVLLIPLLDMTAAIVRRVRKKVPLHLPDKEHLHHKLLCFGFSNRKILAIIYSLTLVLCGAVLYHTLMTFAPAYTSSPVFNNPLAALLGDAGTADNSGTDGSRVSDSKSESVSDSKPDSVSESVSGAGVSNAKESGARASETAKAETITTSKGALAFFVAAWGIVFLFFIVIDRLYKKKVGRDYYQNGNCPPINTPH